MSFHLPELPYPQNALKPHISEETLSFHHGKHHKAYVDKLNLLLEEHTKFQKASLEELICESTGALFNNAAQVWNHTFYWNSLSPKGGGEPGNNIIDILESSFGSIDQFKTEFTQKATGQFGSGWTWLVKDSSGSLSIETSTNAENPLQKGLTPLLTCDVWEHAYYIDYRNARPEYLKAFWQIVNWDFIYQNLQS